MEKTELVRFEKKGRLKLVALTKRGEEAADLFDALAKSLGK
jgi:hypothetical protein